MPRHRGQWPQCEESSHWAQWMVSLPTASFEHPKHAHRVTENDSTGSAIEPEIVPRYSILFER